jgi:hypothetical protein
LFAPPDDFAAVTDYPACSNLRQHNLGNVDFYRQKLNRRNGQRAAEPRDRQLLTAFESLPGYLQKRNTNN